VIGASSGVGRAIARELATRRWDLVVAARSADVLAALADDLARDHAIAATALTLDVCGSDDDLDAFCSTATTVLSTIDAVLITTGAIAARDDGTGAWDDMRSLVDTNLVGVMAIAGRFVSVMEEADNGTLVLFSSIAAEAPRNRNVAYAAAKAGLNAFAASMQHRVNGTGVGVQLVTLGYVRTAMTAGQDLKLPQADPAQVARRVADGLGDGSRTIHEPRWWGLVTRVLRGLPRGVYRRLKF